MRLSQNTELGGSANQNVIPAKAGLFVRLERANAPKAIHVLVGRANAPSALQPPRLTQIRSAADSVPLARV